MNARRTHLQSLAILACLAVLVSGCTRRQLAPGIVAGTGAILTTSGGIYRATLDTEEPFGDTAREVAGTTVLLFGGLGLLLTGVIWSITASHCDDDGDCWTGSVCERTTNTCINRSAAGPGAGSAGADEPNEPEADEPDDSNEADEPEPDVPPERRRYPG